MTLGFGLPDPSDSPHLDTGPSVGNIACSCPKD